MICRICHEAKMNKSLSPFVLNFVSFQSTRRSHVKCFGKAELIFKSSFDQGPILVLHLIIGDGASRKGFNQETSWPFTLQIS